MTSTKFLAWSLIAWLEDGSRWKCKFCIILKWNCNQFLGWLQRFKKDDHCKSIYLLTKRDDHIQQPLTCMWVNILFNFAIHVEKKRSKSSRIQSIVSKKGWYHVIFALNFLVVGVWELIWKDVGATCETSYVDQVRKCVFISYSLHLTKINWQGRDITQREGIYSLKYNVTWFN